jgi:anthranilate phosphoribosyltransferase
MSHAFRELLRKVGSGSHTSKNLTREEAATATRMMLLQEATPAQIGAFMIAHRIKRPTGEELAGMMDTYKELGPQLQPISAPYPVMILGSPYDGRDRTAPLSVLTALILATAGCPVIHHGGGRMPTKEGRPLIDVWQWLQVDWTPLSLSQVQTVLEQTGLGFVYLPQHFSLAQELVEYRSQIGKRPPFATLELFWAPYAGPAHVVAGFVHPPTETRMREAVLLRGTPILTTVKGLEGSCDLPRERTAIIGLERPQATGESGFSRLHLHPQEYGFTAKNVPLSDLENNPGLMSQVLAGSPSELRQSLLWNSGFYLWCCGACGSLEAGIQTAAQLIDEGKAAAKLAQLQGAIAGFDSV